jgi:SAF domain
VSRLTSESPMSSIHANGVETHGAGFANAKSRKAAWTTKRNLPLVGLGVLLVVGCAIGFSSALLRAGGRQEVLVAAHNLMAGHIISSSDLRTAQLSLAGGIASIPASEVSQIIGHPASAAVASGALLTESDVAPSLGPPKGHAVVGLALKPGQYPVGLAPGERVLVVVNSGDSTSSGSSDAADTSSVAPMEGTVLEVESAPTDSSGSMVASIQLDEGDGATVASAASAGNVALAIISSGPSS